ncbi:hypothetical protein EX30DRAFT_68333 [Ascodesmis nigricans]|uniref:Uncharacterized protein n=1 Tax=Ascodesmis nigricans TaxID=341454 RepID=A0A4S2MU33_9PEZI|nr:hypothetical protein EX30DRAFT_68333 [Ascodesmis nigricans]
MARMEPVSVAFGCAMGIAISIALLGIFLGCYKKKFFRRAVNSLKSMEEGRPDMRQRKSASQIVVPSVTRPPPVVAPKRSGDSSRRATHKSASSIPPSNSAKAVTVKSSSTKGPATPVETPSKIVQPKRSSEPPLQTRSHTPTSTHSPLSPQGAPKRVSAPVAVHSASRISEFRSSSAPPIHQISPQAPPKRKPIPAMLPPSPLAPRTYQSTRTVPKPILIRPTTTTRNGPTTPTSTRGPVTPVATRTPHSSHPPLPSAAQYYLGLAEGRSKKSSFSDSADALEIPKLPEERPKNTEIAELPAFNIPEPPLTDHSATIFDIHGRYFSLSPMSSPAHTLHSRPRSVPAESMKEYTESPVLPPPNLPLTPSCASSTYPGTRASSMIL